MVSKYYLIGFAFIMVICTWQVISYFQFRDDAKTFVAQGARFTAADGQALCERIRQLEQNPKPCEYNK